MAVQKSDQIFTIIISICGQNPTTFNPNVYSKRDTPASAAQWHQHPKLCHANLCEVLPCPTGPLRTVVRIAYRIWKHVVSPGLMDDSDASSGGKTAWISLLCGGEYCASSYLTEWKADHLSPLVFISPSAAVETFLGKYLMIHWISSYSSASTSIPEELAPTKARSLDQEKRVDGRKGLPNKGEVGEGVTNSFPHMLSLVKSEISQKEENRHHILMHICGM